jgi:uncharacterized membrane-anchored protein
VRGWKLFAVVALQTAALLVMIGMKQWTLATGTPVALKAAPVDPRSLFRGDYVVLGFEIGRLARSLPGVDDDHRSGQTVYVLLQPGERYWRAVSVHDDWPSAPAGAVVIKGRIQSADSDTLNVRYGIENYFVPEGEGRDLEQQRREEEISFVVAVDRFGKAGIKAVIVNGEERYVESLF